MEKQTNAKRYYWLRLKNTYFSQLEQKKMKRQECGKDMQIIYLRMMLLSIDREGYIYYQGVYDSLEEELAEEFDEPVELVRKTVSFLVKNNMVSIDENDNCFIPEARDCTGSECYSAERMRRKRKRDKASQCYTNVIDCDADVIPCDEEKEIEKEIEKRVDYQQIADMYNNTCVSFPKCTKLSDARKRAIKARMKQYSIEDFQRLFDMAEQSSFLKGKNSRNWSANFDWLIKDTNMVKVLDGNYANTKNCTGATIAPNPSNRFHNFDQRTYDNMNELERQLLEAQEGQQAKANAQ